MSTNINKLELFSQELFHLTKNWLNWDRNEATKKEILDLVENEKFDKLSSCMFGRLSFGTAGMRAPMSAGFNRLNDLTMIQTAQGFLRYLQKAFAPEVLQTRGFVLGYDARHNSQRFAHILTNVFAQNSVKVNLFSKIVPTPFVSFAVTKLECVAGAMVTASHNPKEDNGFKVYWSNGAQILSPHDQNICTSIEKNLEPWPESWDVPSNIYEFSSFVVDPYAKIFVAYMEQALSNRHFKISNSSTSLKFTYTPVHGVGYYFTPELLKQFGFNGDNLCYVKQQIMPDPNFPTAPFPNPEEGKTVLNLAFKTADEAKSTIILANDPDADRFQLAEKQPDGTWRIFSGNEIGGLLAWWLWFMWRKQHPKDAASNVYVINSAVSSRIAGSIAESEGFNYEETLTGFKWMANRAHELIGQGKTVLLCWEESIGYLPGGLSLDKDGVLTAAIFAEYATYLKSSMNNKSFADHLEFLYAKYGHHVNTNSYFKCEDPVVTRRIFDRLRNFDLSGKLTYPKKCGAHPIKFVRDLTAGFDNSRPDNKPILPVSSSTQMITFTLENGSVFTLRASGTEPKIKYYIEIILHKYGNVTEATKMLQEVKKALIEDFLQPDINKLVGHL